MDILLKELLPNVSTEHKCQPAVIQGKYHIHIKTSFPAKSVQRKMRPMAHVFAASFLNCVSFHASLELT